MKTRWKIFFSIFITGGCVRWILWLRVVCVKVCVWERE